MSRIRASRAWVPVICLLVGAGLASVAWWLATREDRGEPTPGGQVAVSYDRGPHEAEQLLRRSGRFDHVAETLNREVALPHDLDARIVSDRTAIQKGIGGPTYVPEDRTVYFPWAFVSQSHDDLVELSKHTAQFSHSEVDEVLANAMEFVLYHELAHGMVDELDVPVLAGQERTADSLATVFSLLSDEEGEALPLSVAVLELTRAQHGGIPSIADYADDHGFDRERAFDAICSVYGSAPKEHRELLSGPHALPSTRAELCPYDYNALVRDWRRTLAPYLTHSGTFLPPGFDPPPKPTDRERDDIADELKFQPGD
jgi:hypothetical protein